MTLKHSFTAADTFEVRKNAAGKLRQPYGEVSAGAKPADIDKILDRLYADAAIAQLAIDKIGAFLAKKFDAVYTPRPEPKDRKRIIDKAVRYGNDFSFITDIASGQLELPLAQIKNTIDASCGDNDDARKLQAELKRLGVVAFGKTENNFSTPDRSDLRNLNTKLGLQITRPDGSKTYHICELQAVHDEAVPFYAASHKHFEVMRTAKGTIQRAGSALARIDSDLTLRDCDKIARDRVRYQQVHDTATKVFQSAESLRFQSNRVAATPALNAFLGYQPRNDSIAPKVAGSPSNDIYSRKLAMTA